MRSSDQALPGEAPIGRVNERNALRPPTSLAAASLAFVAVLVPAWSGGCGGNVVATPDPSPTDGGADSAFDTSPPPLPPEYTACSGPGGCSLVAKTCCGVCGEATVSDMVGVTKTKEGAYRGAVCGMPPPPCPGCASLIRDGSLMALCRGASPRCEAVDIRADPVSVCATDTDCVLQYNTCCQPCEVRSTELIALSTSQIEAFRKYVCVGDEVCSRCATPYPAGATAYCDPATKHCRVKNPSLGF
jgi:hypothetical protein